MSGKAYRVLIGQHIEKDEKGVSRVYKAGDVFVTTSKHPKGLDRHNRPGMTPKFERVADLPAAPGGDGLDTLKQTELVELAATAQIDLKGASKKEDILKTLRQAGVKGR